MVAGHGLRDRACGADRASSSSGGAFRGPAQFALAEPVRVTRELPSSASIDAPLASDAPISDVRGRLAGTAGPAPTGSTASPSARLAARFRGSPVRPGAPPSRPVRAAPTTIRDAFRRAVNPLAFARGPSLVRLRVTGSVSSFAHPRGCVRPTSAYPHYESERSRLVGFRPPPGLRPLRSGTARFTTRDPLRRASRARPGALSAPRAADWPSL